MAKIFLLVLLFALATTQCLAIRRPPLHSKDPKVVRCVDSLIKGKPCLFQIKHSLLIRKPSVEPQCCVVLQTIKKDCADIYIGRTVINPNFNPLLNKYCSNEEGDHNPPSVEEGANPPSVEEGAKPPSVDEGANPPSV